MKLKPDTDGGDYATMIAASSMTTGEIHWETLKKAGFKTDNVIAFLKALRKRHGKWPLAVFWDNQSSFKSNDVKYAASDLDIVLIYNIPARPDLNGMENVWVHVKADYRHNKMKHLLAGLSWDHELLAIQAV